MAYIIWFDNKYLQLLKNKVYCIKEIDELSCVACVPDLGDPIYSNSYDRVDTVQYPYYKVTSLDYRDYFEPKEAEEYLSYFPEDRIWVKGLYREVPYCSLVYKVRDVYDIDIGGLYKCN